MAYPSKIKNRTATPSGFDITCVIGRVEFNEAGDESPFKVALGLIVDHGTDGTFKFPSARGGTHVVTIGYEMSEAELMDEAERTRSVGI